MKNKRQMVSVKIRYLNLKYIESHKKNIKI